VAGVTVVRDPTGRRRGGPGGVWTGGGGASTPPAPAPPRFVSHTSCPVGRSPRRHAPGGTCPPAGPRDVSPTPPRLARFLILLSIRTDRDRDRRRRRRRRGTGRPERRRAGGGSSGGIARDLSAPRRAFARFGAPRRPVGPAVGVASRSTPLTSISFAQLSARRTRQKLHGVRRRCRCRCRCRCLLQCLATGKHEVVLPCHIFGATDTCEPDELGCNSCHEPKNTHGRMRLNVSLDCKEKKRRSCGITAFAFFSFKNVRMIPFGLHYESSSSIPWKCM
jgi:hypothetical protein